MKNVYSVYRASPPAVGFASLSHNSSAIYSSSYNGTGYPNTTLISNIPNGFYGPSGVTSLKTTVTANTITTAIQAGQTAIRPVPLSASGVRRFSLSAGGSWKEGSIGLLVASGLIIALTF